MGYELAIQMAIFFNIAQVKRKTTGFDSRGANDTQILTLSVEGCCEKAFSDRR